MNLADDSNSVGPAANDHFCNFGPRYLYTTTPPSGYSGRRPHHKADMKKPPSTTRSQQQQQQPALSWQQIIPSDALNDPAAIMMHRSLTPVIHNALIYFSIAVFGILRGYSIILLRLVKIVMTQIWFMIL